MWKVGVTRSRNVTQCNSVASRKGPLNKPLAICVSEQSYGDETCMCSDAANARTTSEVWRDSALEADIGHESQPGENVATGIHFHQLFIQYQRRTVLEGPVFYIVTPKGSPSAANVVLFPVFLLLSDTQPIVSKLHNKHLWLCYAYDNRLRFLSSFLINY